MIFYFSLALIVLVACIIIAAMVFADDLRDDGCEAYVAVTVCSIFLGLIWPITMVVGSSWGLALWIRFLISKASSEE